MSGAPDPVRSGACLFESTPSAGVPPSMPVVTLPDGSQRPFDHPLTGEEVAASIGGGLRKAAVAGRVDGKLVDTSFVIDHDAKVAIVTEKDPDGIDVIRHSTAHL